ncbi:MAG: hypothetical protein ACOZFS_05195 [Thermodesulfobacteriota bacterium]
MPKRPPGKGKGADIFLGDMDTPPVKKRPTAKGQGADIFLGTEPCPPQKPPLLAPAKMVEALDRASQIFIPSHGRIDRSHLIVILWLRVALKEAGL